MPNFESLTKFLKISELEKEQNLVFHNFTCEFGDHRNHDIPSDPLLVRFDEFLDESFLLDDGGRPEFSQRVLTLSNAKFDGDPKKAWKARWEANGGLCPLFVEAFIADEATKVDARDWLGQISSRHPGLHERSTFLSSEQHNIVDVVVQKSLLPNSSAESLVGVLFREKSGALDTSAYASFVSSSIAKIRNARGDERRELERKFAAEMRDLKWLKRTPANRDPSIVATEGDLPESISRMLPKAHRENDRALDLVNRTRAEVWWCTPSQQYKVVVNGHEAVDRALFLKELLGIYSDWDEISEDTMFGASHEKYGGRILVEMKWRVDTKTVVFFKPSFFSQGFYDLWLRRPKGECGKTVRLLNTACSTPANDHIGCNCAAAGLQEEVCSAKNLVAGASEIEVLNAAFLSSSELERLARPKISLIVSKA